MAGHSKWSNIKHRKGAQDAKRGKIFTKIIRELTVAARIGGGDASANPRLRAAIDNGLSNNMPKDTIDRAIKRGTGDSDEGQLDEIRYEGYGPAGVAVMVDCMTDNKNRTVAEVRHAFSKMSGNLGTSGSVSYLFTKTGIISYPTGVDEEKIMELALEAGAEDVINNDDGSIDVMTTPESFVDIKQTLISGGAEPESSEVTMQASTSVSLEIKEATTMLKLLEMLEDLDDTQNVYSNAAISDDVLAQLAE